MPATALKTTPPVKRADLALAGVLLIPTLVWALWVASYGSWLPIVTGIYDSRVVGLGLAVSLTLPIIWLRSRPDLSLLLGSGALLLHFASPGVVDLGMWRFGNLPLGMVVLPVLAFAATRYSKHQIRWLLTGLGLVVVAGVATFGWWLSMAGQQLTSESGIREVSTRDYQEAGTASGYALILLAVLMGSGWLAAKWAALARPQTAALTSLGHDTSWRPDAGQQVDDLVGRVRRAWQQNPMVPDAVLAAVLFVPILVWAYEVSMWFGLHAFGRLWLTPSIIAAAYTVPLIWRRTRPDLACALVIPVHLWQLSSHEMLLNSSWTFAGLPLGNIVVPVLLYAAARHSRYANWWLALGLFASAAVGLRWAFRYYWVENLRYGLSTVLVPLISVAVLTFGCALVVVISWGAGRIVRYRQDSTGLAQGRAEAIQREQEQIRRLAAEQERSRIAREMHDIVAHSLSVIVVQADGAGYTLNQPGDQGRQLVVAASALEVIGTTARTALTETRRLVGVLRAEDQETELSPMVSLAALPALIDRTRLVGLPIEACFEGDPAEHAPLGAGVEAAAYRIVQEALTNVIKHAGPGAFATVSVEHTSSGLRIHVRDDGAGPRGEDGQGNGLIGMRERVAAFGGTLVARGRHPNGFEVIATLPAQSVAGRLGQ